MTDFAARRMMMVDTQVRPSDVTKFPVIEAMLTVPREDFVPAGKREVAYVGENVDLGNGRALLEPRTFAKLLDALALSPTDRVLIIGAGFGYGAAVAAHLASAVVAVEEDETALTAARHALAAHGNVKVIAGPLNAGAAGEGHFDILLIEGGIVGLPTLIADQVKPGGKIGAIFMSGALGTAKVGLKEAQGVTWRFAFNATAPVLPGFAAEKRFAL